MKKLMQRIISTLLIVIIAVSNSFVCLAEDVYDFDSLQDLYIWNDALVYGVNGDTSVIITGEWYERRVPDNGVLSIPNDIFGRAVEVIGRYAFSESENLYRVTVPSSVKLIGYEAFSGCPSLTDVVIEEGVETIRKAFSNCPSLIRVVIPASVTQIDANAFDNSNQLFYLSVVKGTYGERYARENGIAYRYSKAEKELVANVGNTVRFGNRFGEPIEWKVLDVKNGEALLIAEKNLTVHSYSEGRVFWGESEIKSYLADTLFYELFNPEEAAVTCMHSVADPAGPYDLTTLPSGDPTASRLFLLSYFEARDYFPSDSDRKSDGAWWLRTRADEWEEAHYVDENGCLMRGMIKSETLGVRPAIWICLDNAESVVKVVDDSTWSIEPSPIKEGYVKGGVVQFGTYEQNGKTEDGKEPLTWNVLSVDDTEALLITRNCIDVRRYHSSETPVNWGQSELRNWLNNEFLNEAFNDEERSALIITPVENTDYDTAKNSQKYSYMIPPIISYDYVWIFDGGEAKSYMPENEDLLAPVTIFARSKGASCNVEGYGNWMLRTDKNDRARANIMMAYRGGASVSVLREDVSIRPVIKVDLAGLGVAETQGFTTEESIRANAFSERWASSGYNLEYGKSSFALLITDDEKLWSWGSNNWGQLGDGTQEDRIYPVEIMNDVKAVSAGYMHGMALLNDGSVWTWGGNDCGQLGDGSFIDRAQPQKVLEDAIAISADGKISMALKADGSVWTWGCNDRGQQADGTNNNRAVPARVTSGAVGIEAGAMTCFVIRNGGTLWACGSADNMFCDGTQKNSYAYIRMTNDIKAVSAGAYHVLALRSDGSLWSWGENDDGRAGAGEGKGDVKEPVRIMDNVTSFSAGRYHSSCVDMDGNLYTFGPNGSGQIGNGEEWGDVYEPEQVLENAVAVLSCWESTLSVMEDGSIWGWGNNDTGLLVNGTLVGSLVPKPTNLSISSLSDYSPFEYDILSDGTAKLVGYYGSGGQIEVPNEIDGHIITIVGNSAFESTGEKITSVIIPETVTTIEDFAFYQCTELAEVHIPSGVTQIGSAAFYGCTDALRIFGDSGSYAVEYAKAVGIAYILTNADE